MEFITKSPEETKTLGRKIGAIIRGDPSKSHLSSSGSIRTRLEERFRGARVLALVGELGSGKTVFVQGLAEGLGIKSKIPSPTFILMRTYQLPASSKQPTVRSLYHLDLYRLEDNVENEVRNLGVEDIWERDENIVVVEWADKLSSLWPKNTQWISFEEIGENERKISINE